MEDVLKKVSGNKYESYFQTPPTNNSNPDPNVSFPLDFEFSIFTQ
jgi:hypothetical protein